MALSKRDYDALADAVRTVRSLAAPNGRSEFTKGYLAAVQELEDELIHRCSLSARAFNAEHFRKLCRIDGGRS